MSTMTDEPTEGAKVVPARGNHEIVSMPRCSRCQLKYLPAKSTSALRLTYCSFLCELGDLGFSMTGLETMVRSKKGEASVPAIEPPAPEPAAAR